MVLVNRNRKILDQKRWEFVSVTPTANGSGKFMSHVTGPIPLVYYFDSLTDVYQSNMLEEGWVLLPTSGRAGTFGAGNGGVAVPWGYGSGTGNFIPVTSGTTSSITVSSTFQRDLRGYSVNILSGNNAGATIPILSSTVGPSSTIYVSSQALAFDSTTTFRLNTPTIYYAPAAAAGDFGKYDYATNVWTTLPNKTGTFATEGIMLATPSWQYNDYESFLSGITTSGTVSSLTVSSANWTSGQWQNFQVRIFSGTGAGQIRTIASSTSNTLTLSSTDLFAITPSSDSGYSIEGNDDYLYYTGSVDSRLYRYSIKRGVWELLAARPSAISTGGNAFWINNVTSGDWNDTNAIKTGRYIYSFRGGSTSNLDVYNIPTNTWISKTYSPNRDTFTTGSRHIYIDDYIYIKKDTTSRVFRYNIVTDNMEGFSVHLLPDGGGAVGNCAYPVRFQEGNTKLDYLYIQITGAASLIRCMVI